MSRPPFFVYTPHNHNTKTNFFASEPRKTPRRTITHKNRENPTEGKRIGKSAKNTASTTKDNIKTQYREKNNREIQQKNTA